MRGLNQEMVSSDAPWVACGLPQSERMRRRHSQGRLEVHHIRCGLAGQPGHRGMRVRRAHRWRELSRLFGAMSCSDTASRPVSMRRPVNIIRARSNCCHHFRSIRHPRGQKQRLIDLPGAECLAHAAGVNLTRASLASKIRYYSDRLLAIGIAKGFM